KYVNEYLAGTYTLDSKIQKLREEGKKSEEDLHDMEVLGREVQKSVREKHLVPAIRSFYNRTAFQLPGDARVRISLDTELTMVREDSFDGKPRAAGNWRRTDIGIDYPFPQLPEKDVCRFPYAILEVKLQTLSGVQPPQWVLDLINSHLVEAVPKFSKFIHGASVLLEDRVDVYPFWFSQMDRDIRKPVTKPIGVSRGPSPRSSMVDINNSMRRRNAGSSGSNSQSSLNGHGNIEVIVEEEPGENLSQNDGNTSQHTHTCDDDGDHATINEGTSLLGRKKGQHKSATASWLQLLNPFGRSSTARSASSNGQQAFPRDAPFVARQDIGDGTGERRIAVPIRVEPKVFFANERTFLAWLNFSILLGSLALGLLNFGDRTGRVAGAAFTMISMFVMVYALMLFQWRAERIRRRESGPYDDRVGPTIVVVVLIAAVVMNFYMKITSTG
ncbi:hypothetical protein LPJ66_009211, partial [Kickxella alabastrina]